MQTTVGPYTIIESIGQGGFSSVWLAAGGNSGEQVAIKFVPIDPVGGLPLRTRLRAEAEILFELDHPQLIELHAHGTDGATDWIVMEWLSGGTLADRLTEQPMPPQAACQITLSLLDVLKYIHERGVVHRDIKPSNLLFDEHDQLHLGDFGIAQIAREANLDLTQDGLGSWSFMAPEQRSSEHPVGPRADLYATGCTLYHMLTGASPMDLFLASPGSPRWSQVPAPLRELLRSATSANPEDRPSDAHSMMHQLQGALPLLGDDVPIPQPSIDEQTTYEPTLDGHAQRGALSLPPPKLPTLDQERVRFSSLDDEYSPRYQGPQGAPEMALSESGNPTRTWLWVGLGVGLVVATSIASRPVIEQVNEATAPVEWVDAGDGPLGEWVGKWASYSARLSLTGPRLDPTGRLMVTLPSGDQIQSRLVGTYDPATRSVRLTDGHPDARFVEYNLTLDMPNLSMQGTLTTREGAIEPCLLVRTAPVRANPTAPGAEHEPL